MLTALQSLLLYSGCDRDVPTQSPASTNMPTIQTQEPVSNDTMPPEITLVLSLKQPSAGNEVEFSWHGKDNATPATSLTYSFYLEGFEASYSPYVTATSKKYSNLPGGSYTFYVKAKDDAGNTTMVHESVEIASSITPPANESPLPFTSGLLIVPGSDINQIAASSYDDIVYALDSVNGNLYKSDHGGFNWTSLSENIPASPNWCTLSIAPDNHDFIALSTDSGTEIYVSNDGGNSFHSTQLQGKLNAGERVKCVAISSGYNSNTREIAVGTSTGTGNGRVFCNKIGSFSGAWQDCSTGARGWPVPGVDIFAIRFSPDFPADGTIIAITASISDTLLFIGTCDIASNTTSWNDSAGYPIEICRQGQDTPGTPLTFADLALPADYSGSMMNQRHIYACWTDNPAGAASSGSAGDGVYRIDDALCYFISPQQDVICTLSHHGSFRNGKLLAGAMYSNSLSSPGVQVYYSVNPMSAYPSWQKSQKPPTGTHNAQVAWSANGKTAFCGTSNIQSAFSRSTDNGLTWNQTGLIDT